MSHTRKQCRLCGDRKTTDAFYPNRAQCKACYIAKVSAKRPSGLAGSGTDADTSDTASDTASDDTLCPDFPAIRSNTLVVGLDRTTVNCLVHGYAMRDRPTTIARVAFGSECTVEGEDADIEELSLMLDDPDVVVVFYACGDDFVDGLEFAIFQQLLQSQTRVVLSIEDIDQMVRLDPHQYLLAYSTGAYFPAMKRLFNTDTVKGTVTSEAIIEYEGMKARVL